MLNKYYTDIVYNSMRIEGVPITIANTIDLLEELNEVNIKDIDKMISKNFISALSYINSIILKGFNKYELLDITKRVNFYIMKTLHSNAGQIRENNVNVLGSKYIPEIKSEYVVRDEVYKNIENFIEEPLQYYCYITRNQLFMDGNKRTALLMTNLLLQVKNENEYFYIPIEEKLKFSKKLVEYYESGDKNEMINYLNKFVRDESSNLKLSWG